MCVFFEFVFVVLYKCCSVVLYMYCVVVLYIVLRSHSRARPAGAPSFVPSECIPVVHRPTLCVTHLCRRNIENTVVMCGRVRNGKDMNSAKAKDVERYGYLLGV